MRTFLLAAAAAGATSAHAQDAESPREGVKGSENIEIGLSTDKVSITSDFNGANLTIFGAIDNTDPLISRQGQYDVVVVLEGPSRPIVVRKKTRVLGMWINTHSEVFLDVPSSYSEALTRRPQDITDTRSYKSLALGADYIHMRPLDSDGPPATLKEFKDALLAKSRAAGLYTERVGGVRFLSRNLFRATVSLAPNVPLGLHQARAFLFRKGIFVKETSAPLTIQKAGVEQQIYIAAHQNSLLYGLAAVFLAALTGWLGRVLFKKD